MGIKGKETSGVSCDKLQRSPWKGVDASHKAASPRFTAPSACLLSDEGFGQTGIQKAGPSGAHFSLAAFTSFSILLSIYVSACMSGVLG